MATMMVREVYDALRESAGEEKARSAASAIAALVDPERWAARFTAIEERFARVETRLTKIERDVAVLKWMATFQVGLLVAVFFLLLRKGAP